MRHALGRSGGCPAAFRVLVRHGVMRTAPYPFRSSGLRRQAGFTLIEALIVMTIMTVLVSVALPSFSDFTREQRIRAASFDLVSDLMLARSEAIKRSGTVSLNLRGTGGEQGWSVRVDSGLHAGVVIRSRDALGNAIALDGASSLVFDRNGRLSGGGTALMAINDQTRAVTRRCVLVDLSGMAQSRVGACA